MDDARFMRGGQRFRQLYRNRQCICQRHLLRGRSRQALTQSFAFDILGDDVVRVSSFCRKRANLVNREDTRMIERRSRARFPGEAADTVGVSREFGGQ